MDHAAAQAAPHGCRAAARARRVVAAEGLGERRRIGGGGGGEGLWFATSKQADGRNGGGSVQETKQGHKKAQLVPRPGLSG